MTEHKEIFEKAKLEIKNFGSSPIKEVGQILNIIQSAEVPEKDVLRLTQEFYIRLFQDNGRGDLNQARQSWVVASGNNFEAFIRNFINDELNQEGILAIKGDELKGKEKAKNIVEFLTLKASRRCIQTNTGVWPDSDIVVIAKENSGDLKAFALLNCKTSDHSRNDAVLFWALALRDNNIKYCLVTQDLDKRFVKGDFNPRISGLRRKSEAYLDRVYTTNPLTEECSQIRKLDFTKANGASSLLNDLRIWRKEVIPDFTDGPISKDIIF